MVSEAFHECIDLDDAVSVNILDLFSEHFTEYCVECLGREVEHVFLLQYGVEVGNGDKTCIVLVETAQLILELQVVNVHLAEVAVLEKFLIVNLA